MIETSECIEPLGGDRYRCRNTCIEIITTQLPIVCCRKPSPRRMAAIQHGVGTQLHRLLGAFGIHPTKDCQCKSCAAKMNRLGPNWCEANIDEIVDWMQEESEARSVPFSRFVAAVFVKIAIRKARRRLNELGYGDNDGTEGG